MNDTDLAAALRAIHREAAAIADPSTLRARVLAIPTERPRSSPRRWGRSMRRWGSWRFGTRLIAAVAIVALATGTIFLAASQSPSPEPTIAPSPTVWTLPPGFVSEEVEPGVLRVLSDGVRDLPFPDEMAPDGVRIATGLDGSVWLFLGSGSFRLGDARIHEALPYFFHRADDYEVGIDGTLWFAPSIDSARGDLAAFKDDAWIRYRGPDGQPIHQVEVLGDGTIWASWQAGSDIVVGRLDGDAWSIERQSPHARYEELGDPRGILSVSDNGDIWVDGQRLDPDQPDAGPVVPDAGEFSGIAPDGTFWVRTGGTSLARVDATGLTRYDAADGVPNMCCVGEGRPGEFVVAPDGSLWITSQGGCGSALSRFDGSTWTKYRQCAGEIDVAPDGALWFTGDGLYVIPPVRTGG